MSSDIKHKTEPDISAESFEKITSARIQWDRTREHIWEEMEKKLSVAKPPRVIAFSRPIGRLAIAATIAVLAGISAFMQIYSKTIQAEAGRHAVCNLPDGSQVQLNAESRLSYKPLLWRFTRKVSFEGEGFFEVVAGNKFNVVSELGTTTVLGTSFNVYSREKVYRVTCLTGQVKVSEHITNTMVVLKPGQKAALNQEGRLEVHFIDDAEQHISWLHDKFYFTAAPLPEVFEEIGRQYGVNIHLNDSLDNTYTGTFLRTLTVDDALRLVCRPFDLYFTQTSDDEYIVSGGN